MNVYAVCGFAVASACIIALLRQIRPELATISVALVGVLIFIYLLNGLSPFVAFLKNTAMETGNGGYFALMLKSLAISLCCRVSADVCRDCGESSLASRVELAGKVSIVIISIPVVEQLFGIAKDMLG
ncbi:MAG: stage III sporulation protein AD [Clostridia bacterium]|nr:stage III sporulation protein AD [Clostridia bacterium]MBR6754422.1 stage III sporulation protein AD [Clostridia bacterium]